MITKIELALIERLKQGLGRLAYEVAGYHGELDDENLDIRRLPCVLVSYGGSQLTPKAMSVQGKRFESSDTFVVIVITKSLRTDGTARHGTQREVGANQLLQAVKYLLNNQTLGHLVQPISPKRVRTLWNNQEVKREKLSAYALEFEVRYLESCGLADGAFPLGSDNPNEVEYLFSHYQGKLDEPEPDLHSVVGEIFEPNSDARVAFEVKTDESKSS